MKPNWIKTIDNEEYIKLNEAMEMVKERDNYIKQQSNAIDECIEWLKQQIKLSDIDLLELNKHSEVFHLEILLTKNYIRIYKKVLEKLQQAKGGCDDEC